jgi:hypothetical protein
MAFSVAGLLKEGLTLGHGLAAAVGAFLHKAYADLKAALAKAKAAAEAAKAKL